ncbi:hypothetical protein BH09VER1_BH09VER1_37000 [soil metagenome]
MYDRGTITEEEFVGKLTDCFAGSEDWDTKDAADVAALIPQSVRAPVTKRIDSALSPGYLRRAFAMGGRGRTAKREHAAALRETAREKAWAAALKPFFS